MRIFYKVGGYGYAEEVIRKVIDRNILEELYKGNKKHIIGGLK